MARSPDQAKRRQLLDQVRAYVIRNGLGDLSLRPLARALGTSDRMLLYYFGTKERMIAEAVATDEGRPLLRARDVLGTGTPPRDAAGMRRLLEELWRRFAVPDQRAMLPLYFEMMAVSLLHPDRYGPVMYTLLSDWVNVFTPLFAGLGLDEEQARNEAVLLVNTYMGMLLAPLADNDWDRAGAAFRTLLDRLEPNWPGARTSTSA